MNKIQFLESIVNNFLNEISKNHPLQGKAERSRIAGNIVDARHAERGNQDEDDPVERNYNYASELAKQKSSETGKGQKAVLHKAANRMFSLTHQLETGRKQGIGDQYIDQLNMGN